MKDKDLNINSSKCISNSNLLVTITNLMVIVVIEGTRRAI